MQIGKYKIHLLETGTFGLDGGAMFGIIPKPLWSRSTPSDEQNRIKLGARCLMLDSGKKKILVETGIGTNWDEKFRKIYNLNTGEKSLEDSLNKLGCKPEDITDVILTHLHFDHTGGSTKLQGEEFIPAFPNAKYHIQKKQFEWALNPSDKDRGSYIPHTFKPLNDHGVLKFFEGEHQYDDEIEIFTIDGHTYSQQILKISDSMNTYLFCADLIPTMHHIPIPYVMGYDIQPLLTVKEKSKYLQLAADNKWKLIFGHDPFNACATVKQTEKGFNFDQYSERLF